MIRGATPHFDVVVREAAAGVGALAAEGKLAVAFGVLACDNIEQAVERAGAKAGNRGADAAMVAVEMADLYARMAAEKAGRADGQRGADTRDDRSAAPEVDGRGKEGTKMAGPRRRSREIALQILHQIDVGGVARVRRGRRR